MPPQLDQSWRPDHLDEAQPNRAHPTGIDVEPIGVQRRIPPAFVEMGVTPERERCVGNGVDKSIWRLPLDDLLVPAAVRDDAEQLPVRVFGPAGGKLVPRIAAVVGDGEPGLEQMNDKVEVRRNAPDLLDWSRQQRWEIEALDGLVATEVGHGKRRHTISQPLSPLSPGDAFFPTESPLASAVPNIFPRGHRS